MSLDHVIADTVRDAVLDALRLHNLVPREAYSVAEAAHAIGRSESYVRRLVEDGELPARKAGPNGHTLIPVAALRSWLMGGAS
jgi:excisionase family DNA binding protein